MEALLSYRVPPEFRNDILHDGDPIPLGLTEVFTFDRSAFCSQRPPLGPALFGAGGKLDFLQKSRDKETIRAIHGTELGFLTVRPDTRLPSSGAHTNLQHPFNLGNGNLRFADSGLLTRYRHTDKNKLENGQGFHSFVGRPFLLLERSFEELTPLPVNGLRCLINACQNLTRHGFGGEKNRLRV